MQPPALQKEISLTNLPTYLLLVIPCPGSCLPPLGARVCLTNGSDHGTERMRSVLLPHDARLYKLYVNQALVNSLVACFACGGEFT